eukprot:1161726-Pelagomonas_calceolata.AAC.7
MLRANNGGKNGPSYEGKNCGFVVRVGSNAHHIKQNQPVLLLPQSLREGDSQHQLLPCFRCCCCCCHCSCPEPSLFGAFEQLGPALGRTCPGHLPACTCATECALAQQPALAQQSVQLRNSLHLHNRVCSCATACTCATESALVQLSVHLRNRVHLCVFIHKQWELSFLIWPRKLQDAGEGLKQNEGAWPLRKYSASLADIQTLVSIKNGICCCTAGCADSKIHFENTHDNQLGQQRASQCAQKRLSMKLASHGTASKGPGKQEVIHCIWQSKSQPPRLWPDLAGFLIGSGWFC